MSAISCTQTTLQNVIAVLDSGGTLFNPNAFVNPQITILNNLRTTNWDKHGEVLTAIAGLNPLSPTYAADLAKLTDLEAAIETLAGHDSASYLTSRLGQYQYWTDFLSGKISFFPSGPLADITGGIPNAAIIGTLTFAGLIGATMGGKTADDALCLLDPESPCAGVNSLFGSILGTFNTVLGTIQTGLDFLTNMLAQAVEYVTLIVGWVADIVGRIAAEINKLVLTLLTGIRYGLAKLLTALRFDPCLGAIINEIASEALQDALATVPP
jgi:hypothetical protein